MSGARHFAVLVLAAVGLLVVTMTAAASPIPEPSGLPQAPSGEQTHPRVRPAFGEPHTAFAVLFSLREAPGHHGALSVDYRVGVSRPARSPSSCASPQPSIIDSGAVGEVKRLVLTSPAGGWCAGRYRATVLLQRGPYCPPPVEGQPPTPCPEFASQELETGAATFTVGPRRQVWQPALGTTWQWQIVGRIGPVSTQGRSGGPCTGTVGRDEERGRSDR